MENCIEIKGLTKKYEDFKLDNVDFTVKRGSVMGFVGENGAGKTTTIKAILNLIKKDSGSINIFGLDNIESEKEIKEQIGVVFDDINFHETLNIKEINMIMKNIYSAWDEKKFFKMTEEFDLPNKKSIKNFSRGMKMKLSIAVALSHNAKLLILDEATSGLDPIVRNEILDIFLEFMEDEEHTILVSSHILNDLERIADYITFIHKGKIVFSKEKYELIETHGMLKCGINDKQKIDKKYIVGERKSSFGYEILVKNREKCREIYNDMVIDKPTMEDIVLFYVRGNE